MGRNCLLDFLLTDIMPMPNGMFEVGTKESIKPFISVIVIEMVEQYCYQLLYTPLRLFTMVLCVLFIKMFCIALRKFFESSFNISFSSRYLSLFAPSVR